MALLAWVHEILAMGANPEHPVGDMFEEKNKAQIETNMGMTLYSSVL